MNNSARVARLSIFDQTNQTVERGLDQRQFGANALMAFRVEGMLPGEPADFSAEFIRRGRFHIEEGLKWRSRLRFWLRSICVGFDTGNLNLGFALGASNNKARAAYIDCETLTALRTFEDNVIRLRFALRRGSDISLHPKILPLGYKLYITRLGYGWTEKIVAIQRTPELAEGCASGLLDGNAQGEGAAFADRAHQVDASAVRAHHVLYNG